MNALSQKVDALYRRGVFDHAWLRAAKAILEQYESLDKAGKKRVTPYSLISLEKIGNDRGPVENAGYTFSQRRSRE